MKADVRYHMSWGRRVRFFVRLLGITAVLAAGVGALYAASILPDWSTTTIAAAAKDDLGSFARVAVWLMLGGGLIAVFALVVEALNALTGGASSRGAAGVMSVVQIALAVAILGAVNVYAFLHEADFDLTRNQQFTLPPPIVSELQKLHSETTIVVLQQHKTFGHLTDKPDRFDYAAERKVVEKVQDTVDQFRKLGPQFKVVVLDVEEEGFDRKLEELTRHNPPLRAAIQTAPENSIFFSSDGNVQRMSFNEFYLLDKAQSKHGGGNLVLQQQGLSGFVQRILAIQEKRPKVALVSMHHALSSEADQGQELISLAGMRKSLEQNGFDVTDLILKQNHRAQEQFDGDAAAFSLDENQLQRLEEEFADAETSVRVDEAYVKKLRDIQKRLDAVKNESAKKRNTLYREFAPVVLEQQLPRDLTEEEEQIYLFRLERLIGRAEQELADSRQQREEVEGKLKSLRRQERAVEDRRLVDVKAKLDRLLADCDLVIVPRITIINATSEERLPYSVHKMKEVHVNALKEFMKAGKPVLVCTGPMSESDNEPVQVFDELEQLLKDRGVELGQETILFDSERKAFTARSAGSMFGGSDVPPITFDPPDGGFKKQPNPLGQIMLALQRSIDEKLNIKLRAPRPVTVTRELSEGLPYSAEFMWTTANCWNEMFPFPEFRTRRTPNGIVIEPVYIPRFDPITAADKKKGFKNDERRGPFSVGIAIESALPRAWFKAKNDGEAEEKSDDGAVPRIGRLVVIGQGGVFAGTELKPATESLLLNTCNWLLTREDRLAHPEAAAWHYPRVEMSEGAKEMWHWGAFLGLPALFVYLGLVVLMIRRIR